MTLQLYAHPFSSYSQKVLIALYENATPFEFCMLDADHTDHVATLHSHWSIGKFPMLLDDGQAILESTIIIEHLGREHPGKTILLPNEDNLLAEVRLLDRLFDNYVMTPMQSIVNDALRPDDARHSASVTEAQNMLDKTYRWLDERIAGREWAAGDTFTLADCAAAPALFYADWVHPIPGNIASLRDYRSRLLAHPSVQRAVDEARPYRPLFPLGAPNRD
jgi:glutathione S-transferase